MQEKLAQLAAKIEADPSLVEKLFALETPTEVQESLQEQGLEFTLEEINGLRELLVKELEKGTSGELSDDDLEDVAGGFVITGAILGGVAALIGAVAGGVDSAVRSRW